MRLFISYTHVDKAIVKEWVVRKLTAGGHDVWFDDRLVVGQDWKQQLSDEIEHSDALVYCMTPEAVASDWCQWELARAVDLGKPIIPVLLQTQAQLSDHLKKLQFVDFSDGPTGDAVARLMGGLQNLSPAQIPPAPAKPKGKPPQAIEHNTDTAPNIIMKIIRDPLWQFVGIVVTIVIALITYSLGESGDPNQSAAQSTPSTPRINAQQNMDIRNGPGTNFSRIAVLNAGDHLDILGISDDDRWYQVLLPDGNTGWVVAASAAGEVSGPMGALIVIVPTQTPTSTATRTPTAVNTSTLPATGAQPPTVVSTQTDSATSTTALSNTPQPPTDTLSVDSTSAETPEAAITTPEVVDSGVDDRDCASQFGIEMVFVPATTFSMGSDIGQSNERPEREVTVHGFCIDVFEVTNSQYARCVNDGICTPPRRLNSRTVDSYYESENHGRFPVVNVAWEQAQTYCEYRGGRLPTEAEWELVARYDPESGMVRTFPWGRQTADTSKANYEASIFGDPVEGGQHPLGINPFGVHDLSGNVAEWVFDWFGPYRSIDVDNPVGPIEGNAHVVRGGSFASSAEEIRGSYRDSQSPNVISDQVGFRCVIP